MKKIILSLVSIFVLSEQIHAGGRMKDVEPAIEPIVEIPEVVEANTIYVGLSMGETSINDHHTDEEITATTLTFQAGYKVKENLALEGRFGMSLDGSDYDAGIFSGLDVHYDGDIYTWGIYAKPMYSFNSYTFYGLLGYGEVILEDLDGGDSSEDGFQWGLGASYAFIEEVSLFVDYISLYDDKGFDNRAINEDINADVWTFGVSYKF